MSKVFRQHHGESQGPRPTETPYAEDGTYGVVGGRGLVTPSYPIAETAENIMLERIMRQKEGLVMLFLCKLRRAGLYIVLKSSD